MVVTRAVVLITSTVLTGPLLRFGIGFVVSVQLAPVGRPELQENETLSGKPFALAEWVGVIVAVYVAGTPAGAVAVLGETEILKSLTNADVVKDCVHVAHPCTVTDAVFPKLSVVVAGVVLAIGVSTTVAVAVAPAFRFPIVQLTMAAVAVPQVPELTVAEVNEAPELGRLSVKMMLLAGSPVLLIVYSKLT